MKRFLSLMVLSTVALVAVFAYLRSSPASAKPECELYRPTAGQDVETLYRGNLAAELERVFGLAAANGNLEGEFRKFEKDTLYKYDEPMRMFALRAYIHFACENIDGPVDADELQRVFGNLLEGPTDSGTQANGSSSENRTTGDCSNIQSNISGNANITLNNSCN